MNKEALQKIQAILLDIKNELRVKVTDADFQFTNGERHYQKHMDDRELPSDMTLQQYLGKSKEVSLKSINGRNVRAYSYSGNKVAKTDGNWFVSYVGGKGGIIVTSFPLRGGASRFDSLMNRDYGTELKKE